MLHKIDTMKINDLPELYYQEWQPKKQVKAIILVIHGLGEHGGRYGTDFAKYYTEAGFAILAPDLPGHGKSGGSRGHIPDPTLFLDIIDHFLALIKKQFPGLPIYLYGHSMGGQIVLWHNLLRSPLINGVIVTSPSIRTKDPIPPFKKLMARLMDKLLPSFSMDNGLDVNQLSRDKEVVNAYINDPFVHKKVSARLGMMIMSQGDWIIDHASNNSIPMLVMIGSDEGIVNKAAVDHFCAQTPNVDYKVWAGLYHEIHNEPQKIYVFDYTLEWINSN